MGVGAGGCVLIPPGVLVVFFPPVWSDVPGRQLVFLLVVFVSCWLCSDPVVAYVPGRLLVFLSGACLRFFLLYAFYTLPCSVLLIIWKNSSREAWVRILSGGVGADPAGRRGWLCSVFVEKTNKEKKTRKRVKKFIKKC